MWEPFIQYQMLLNYRGRKYDASTNNKKSKTELDSALRRNEGKLVYRGIPYSKN